MLASEPSARGSSLYEAKAEDMGGAQLAGRPGLLMSPWLRVSVLYLCGAISAAAIFLATGPLTGSSAEWFSRVMAVVPLVLYLAAEASLLIASVMGQQPSSSRQPRHPSTISASSSQRSSACSFSFRT